MPYFRLFYHLVWPTKNHDPLITPLIEKDLFTFMMKKSQEVGSRILEINGIENHVHLIIEIPPKITITEVVKRLKGSSSRQFPDLFWAVGYGAFTVSERNLNPAIDYVRNQKQHHLCGNTIKNFEYSDQETLSGNRMVREGQSVYQIDDLEF